MSDSERIVLKTPIQFGSETIEALDIRRGRAGDLKGIKVGGEELSMDSLLLIGSRITGQSLAVIEKLDMDDAGEVLGRASDFFARCLRTGRGQSQ